MLDSRAIPTYMGVELPANVPSIGDLQSDSFSDSETLYSIIGILEGVRMAPNLIAKNDREQYEHLLSIVDPTKELGSDEALLVTVLKVLSQAVYRIDPVYHVALLSNIFSISFWNCGIDARNALKELLTSMAFIPDRFLDGCLLMIVSNFQPPRPASNMKWIWRKKDVQNQLYMVLRWIIELVPSAFLRLKDIIGRTPFRQFEPKEALSYLVECMLGLESNEFGEYVGSTVLVKVLDLLMELDVNITWKGMFGDDDDDDKQIFVMEFVDIDENDGAGDKGIRTKDSEEREMLSGNILADKLDALMVIMFQHLKNHASEGHLTKVFETLLDVFHRTVLNTYKSKFTQYVIFYACSLDPENCGEKFAQLLENIYLSRAEDSISRMSAVAYLASYLSRAKFISTSFTISKLERLVLWCLEYCQCHDSQERTLNPKSHRLFYSGCQAVMYTLCYRMRFMMASPELKSRLKRMPLERILNHALSPLLVCLPSIVREFQSQAEHAHLFKGLVTSLNGDSLESDFSMAFGGVEKLHMFFPFDPYLLKESDRFILPNYQFWQVVVATPGGIRSDDLDHDVSEDGESEEGEDSDDDDDDGMGLSLNKMSITPRPVLFMPARMPARIRPSVSP